MKSELWNVAIEIDKSRQKILAFESQLDAAIQSGEAKPNAKIQFYKAVSTSANASMAIGKLIGSLK